MRSKRHFATVLPATCTSALPGESKGALNSTRPWLLVLLGATGLGVEPSSGPARSVTLSPCGEWARTMSSLRSGTDERAEHFGARAHGLGAVGEHDGGDAGIDGRRHPGVEPHQGRGGAGRGRERRAQALETVAAGGEQGDGEENEEARAERVRILAVGARRGPRRLELGHEAGEAGPVRRPEQRRLVLGRAAELVLIGGGGAVLDLRGALQPPQRLGARGQRQAEERQQREDQGEAEGAEQDAVKKRRQQAPQIEQRDDEKDADHEEGPQQDLPDALGKKGKPAQRHAPLEAAGERLVGRGRRVGGLGAAAGSHHGLCFSTIGASEIKWAGKRAKTRPLRRMRRGAQSQSGSVSAASIAA